jgi:hypothetical protein
MENPLKTEDPQNHDPSDPGRPGRGLPGKGAQTGPGLPGEKGRGGHPLKAVLLPLKTGLRRTGLLPKQNLLQR